MTSTLALIFNQAFNQTFNCNNNTNNNGNRGRYRKPSDSRDLGIESRIVFRRARERSSAANHGNRIREGEGALALTVLRAPSL